ncbi:MAG: glycosyltransferase [Oscillospiraceae bacterium]|nr:glycosyltransferase [Oscillospiraceae bacterium]
MDSNKQTIMLYLTSLHKGGAERVFVQLAEKFAECGYKSIIVTSFVDKNKGEYELSDNVLRLTLEDELIVQSRLMRNYTRIKKLRALCKQYKPAILISCMQEPNFRAVLATAGLPIKNLVSVCNAADKEYPGILGKIVGKVLMPTAEGCVFQTVEEKVWFPKRLQDKGRIIMNQVNSSFFEHEFNGERHDFVSVGRLNPQKNQALLIRAFNQIKDKTDESLFIYGEGELKENLQALINELGLEERVKLMGTTSDVANAIKGARAFVMSSDYEGLPNALLEALALGLPCICTDCLGGGPAMVINSGENGILVPMGDEDALAQAMLGILADSEKAEALGKAAKISAENFRPEKVFELWRDYVEDILSK